MLLFDALLIYSFTGVLTQIVLRGQNPNLCRLGNTLCAVEIILGGLVFIIFNKYKKKLVNL